MATEEAWSGKRVKLHGLVGAAELNGRHGLVLGPGGSSGRWEVKLEAAGRGQEERTLSVKSANLAPAPAKVGPTESATGAATGDGDTAPSRRPRPTAMSARPGEFLAGYDWREVLPNQALPRGLEIIASLEGHDGGGAKLPTLARIPSKWRLEVAVVAQATPQKLGAGSRVRLGGLKARPDLNGRVGVVTGWAAQTQRFTVDLDEASSASSASSTSRGDQQGGGGGGGEAKSETVALRGESLSPESSPPGVVSPLAHARLDVERATSLAEVAASVARQHPRLFPGPSAETWGPGEGALVVGGVACALESSATVEEARLFGKKVECIAKCVPENAKFQAEEPRPLSKQPTSAHAQGKPISRLDGLRIINSSGRPL